jgi:hypothetical protein
MRNDGITPIKISLKQTKIVRRVREITTNKKDTTTNIIIIGHGQAQTNEQKERKQVSKCA